MARSGIITTDKNAQEAADKVLSAGGGAVQAAITGFYAAAGADPGILFSPLSFLVGGVGSGVVAYDGRCRQPGRDAKRPRGFLPEEELPPASAAAAPSSVFATAIALAFHPGATLLACVRPGVQVAKAHGSSGRARLLEYVATLGATALRETSVKQAFITQFGALEGGAVTATDLVAPEGLQAAARSTPDGWVPPWQASPEDSGTEPHQELNSGLGQGHGLVAADSHGIFVSLAFSSLESDLLLAPFDVSIPCLATPVMRGVTRKSPGTPLRSSGSLAIEQDNQGRVVGASVVPGPGTAPLHLYRNTETREVSQENFLRQQ